jgi:hypothetical protein
MFRLIGFLIGSATSVFIILLIIGMPTFHLNDDDEAQQRYDAAIEKLREKQDEFESVAGKLSEDVARVAQSVESGLANEPEARPELRQGVEPPVAEPLEDLPPPDEVVAPAPEAHWYSFWNPFRSELAANGFVAQLERVTGLDYRVVKVESGVYEVAFAYADDAERRDKLSRISAATGLNLPDS